MDALTKPSNKLVPLKKMRRFVENKILYKKLKKQIDEDHADLLAITQELGLINFKTTAYTLTRAKRVTPKVESFKRLRASLDTAKIPYQTEEVFTPQMSVLFRELVRQGKDLDGLETIETEYISIRTREEKK